MKTVLTVSILSQPEGRELLLILEVVNLLHGVSILSQPEGRELPGKSYHALCEGLFQSSPSPKAGSYLPTIVEVIADEEFQSSPSPKAGSYLT